MLIIECFQSGFYRFFLFAFKFKHYAAMHVYLDNLNSVCIYLDTEIEQLVLTILTVLLIDPYKKLQIKRFQKQGLLVVHLRLEVTCNGKREVLVLASYMVL